MRTIQIFLVSAFAVLVLGVNQSHAQLGYAERHLKVLLGDPVKKHRSGVPIPTNIYIKDGIQAQICFDGELSNGAVYTIAALENGRRKALTNSDVSVILAWNNIKYEHLKKIGESGKKIIYVDRLKKYMIIHDKASHIYTIMDHDEAIRAMAKELK